MAKVIFGFVGKMSSGKGTSVAYLKEKYNAATFSYSTMLRDTLDRFYLPHTRDNMIDLSVFVRGRFGEDTMAKAVAHDIEKDAADFVAVEGIRRLADIEYLKKLPGFILVEIVVDQKTRFERLKNRGQNPDDASKTWEEFLADAEKPTEVSIREVAAHASEKVDNNGSFEKLYRQLDKLVEKYQ